MKRIALGLICASLVAGGADAEETKTVTPMKCDTGPIVRRFGGNDWIVYSCEDQRSVVVIASESNPAVPFYFVVKLSAGKLDLAGEGTGDKRASDAAGNDLSRLSAADLSNLIADTKDSNTAAR